MNRLCKVITFSVWLAARGQRTKLPQRIPALPRTRQPTVTPATMSMVGPQHRSSPPSAATPYQQATKTAWPFSPAFLP